MHKAWRGLSCHAFPAPHIFSPQGNKHDARVITRRRRKKTCFGLFRRRQKLFSTKKRLLSIILRCFRLRCFIWGWFPHFECTILLCTANIVDTHILCPQESVSEPTDSFGCGGSVLGYRVRASCRVQGEAWPESLVLDPGRGTGRAICFQFRAMLGQNRLFGLRARPECLVRVHKRAETG